MFNIKKFFNLTYYTSPLDQFLESYRQKHSRLSSSQQTEKTKHDIVFKMRDKPQKESTKKTILD
jgi:hypothetical protein